MGILNERKIEKNQSKCEQIENYHYALCYILICILKFDKKKEMNYKSLLIATLSFFLSIIFFGSFAEIGKRAANIRQQSNIGVWAKLSSTNGKWIEWW